MNLNLVYTEAYYIYASGLHYLSKYSVTERKTYAHLGRPELKTEFYTDDVLSSLNSILQIYVRVEKNAQK